jgi:hypothetical protein
MSTASRRRGAQKVQVGRNVDTTLTSLKLIRGRDVDETGNEFPDLFVSGGMEVKKTLCVKTVIVTQDTVVAGNSNVCNLYIDENLFVDNITPRNSGQIVINGDIALEYLQVDAIQPKTSEPIPVLGDISVETVLLDTLKSRLSNTIIVSSELSSVDGNGIVVNGPLSSDSLTTGMLDTGALSTDVVMANGAVFNDYLNVQGTVNIQGSASIQGPVKLAFPLQEASGGTGTNNYASGDILYASNPNSLSKRAIGTTGQVLTVNAAGFPTWTDVPAVTAVTTFQTDLSGLTPNAPTSGVVTLSGTLGETSGGTNQTTYATGDLLYASGANTLGKRTIGASGQTLVVSGGVPAWGTLGETSGGTNQTTYATGDLLYASGANTLAKRPIGTAGQVLTVSGGVPTWQNPSGTAVVTMAGAVTGPSNSCALSDFAVMESFRNFTGSGYQRMTWSNVATNNWLRVDLPQSNPGTSGACIGCSYHIRVIIQGTQASGTVQQTMWHYEQTFIYPGVGVIRNISEDRRISWMGGTQHDVQDSYIRIRDTVRPMNYTAYIVTTPPWTTSYNGPGPSINIMP